LCSDEFLKVLYATIEWVLSASVTGHREGLLALEELIDNEKAENRELLDYGLRLVVDGTDESVIDKLISNIINQEKDEQLKLLKNIQKEGILALQCGMNTRMIAALLNSYTDIPLSDPLFKKWLIDGAEE